MKKLILTTALGCALALPAAAYTTDPLQTFGAHESPPSVAMHLSSLTHVDGATGWMTFEDETVAYLHKTLDNGEQVLGDEVAFGGGGDRDGTMIHGGYSDENLQAYFHGMQTDMGTDDGAHQGLVFNASAIIDDGDHSDLTNGAEFVNIYADLTTWGTTETPFDVPSGAHSASLTLSIDGHQTAPSDISTDLIVAATLEEMTPLTTGQFAEGYVAV